MQTLHGVGEKLNDTKYWFIFYSLTASIVFFFQNALPNTQVGIYWVN